MSELINKKTLLIYFLGFLLILTQAIDLDSKKFVATPDMLLITRGLIAEPHSAPYLAFIRKKTSINSTTQCVGALLSHNYVLTAGHCFKSTVEIDVYLGVHNVSSPSIHQIMVPAESWTAYANGENCLLHDIGIIKLKESVNYTKGVQPATLPSRADVNRTYVGDTGRVFGWGLKEDYRASDVLLYADMPIMDNNHQNCQRPMTFICAEKINKCGTCKGDSGAPLVVNNVTVGIVHGSQCILGNFTTPSYFARVTKYLDWIEENSDILID